ncbi:MAG: hypothetical protein M5U12_03255 [Verrucomicrobia bacterium]|nr:hypothetical protein [Verrucomicrobiota bacterium]
MSRLTITLPPQPAQTAFNLRRWEEVLADTGLAKLPGRIETDRHGHILMSPPPLPIMAATNWKSAIGCDNSCPTGGC